MDLSIIIPVYNVDSEKLERCLSSIIKIERIEYEVILVNDGSCCNLTKKYEEIIKKYDKVKYVYKNNGGVSSARNRGIDESSGKYLMFVDADDAIIAENLKKDVLDLEMDIFIYDKFYIKNERKTKYIEFQILPGTVNNAMILNGLVSNNKFHSPWGKLIRRDFLNEHKVRFDCKLIQGEDAVFNLDMLEYDPKIYYVDKVLYQYYYDYNTSNGRWKNNPNQMLESIIYLHRRKRNIMDKFETSERQLIEKKFCNNSIRNFFRTTMSLCSDKKNNLERLNSISQYVKSINLTNPKIEIVLKYKMICNCNWNIIGCISKLRNFYFSKIKYRKKGGA